MKTAIRALFALSVLPFVAAAADAAKNCGCACCKGKPVCCCHAGEKSDAAETHPLRGEIVAVSADHTELTVKHEAIPDFMPAMTMVFKVDASAGARLKAGQKISALLYRRGEDFWLRDIKSE